MKYPSARPGAGSGPSSGMDYTILFPLVLSIVGFILTMLALFAGNTPGYMEDYHIIMLNTSELGHNLVPTPSSGGNTPTSTSGGSGIGAFFSGIVHSATAAVGAIESDLASVENDVADELAAALGIRQFYSLHAMDVCEGYFTPNATAPHAGYNVTNCTTPLKMGELNVSAILDRELSVGPLHLTLSDLGMSQNLQDDLNRIPAIIMAMAVFYIVGAAFSGLSMLAAAAGLVALRRSPLATVLGNFAFTTLAAIALLIADLIASIGARVVTSAVSDYGSGIGLAASAGAKFMAISWAAFALMVVASFYWACKMWPVALTWRRTRRERRAAARGKGQYPLGDYNTSRSYA